MADIGCDRVTWRGRWICPGTTPATGRDPGSRSTLAPTPPGSISNAAHCPGGVAALQFSASGPLPEPAGPELTPEKRPWPGWLPGPADRPPTELPEFAFPLAFLVGAFLAPLVWIVLVPLDRDAASPALVTRACLVSLTQFLTTVAVLAACGPVRWNDLGLALRDWRREALAGVAGLLLALVPVYAVNWLVTLQGWRTDEGDHPLFKLLQAYPHDVGLWVQVSILAVVLAPLAEELLFRVILQGWLQRHVPPWLAIVAVAVIFSAAHVDKGRPDYLPLFPLALILGALYYRTRSYLSVAVMHMLFNGLNVAMFLCFGG